MDFHISFLRESLEFTQNKAAACIWLPVGQEVQSFHIVKTEGFLKEHAQAGGLARGQALTGKGLLSPRKMCLIGSH